MTVTINGSSGITNSGTDTAASYSGAGTGLTGTATSLSIGGNAATATILKAASGVNSSSSGWVPASNIVWGQGFQNTSISTDTGDIVYWLRASQYSGGGTELCVSVDGDIYVGSGNYKVLHAGNYNSYGVSASALPTGSVIQVVSTTKQNIFSTTSTSPVAITGMSATITPQFSSSKILVLVSINIGTSTTVNDSFVQLLRNGTSVGNGTAGYFGTSAGQSNFEPHTKSMCFFDSPNTTSSLTYAIYGWAGSGVALYVNSRGALGDFITSSHITLMEVR